MSNHKPIALVHSFNRLIGHDQFAEKVSKLAKQHHLIMIDCIMGGGKMTSEFVGELNNVTTFVGAVNQFDDKCFDSAEVYTVEQQIEDENQLN